MGSISGVVCDEDFDAPLAIAQVTIAQTGQRFTASNQRLYVFEQLEPGRYTLVFSKPGCVQKVISDVAVTEGQLTDINVSQAK